MADIPSFFASSTSTSTTSTSNISSNEAESEQEIEVSPSKAPSSSKSELHKKRSKSRSTSSTRKYLKFGKKIILGYIMTHIVKVHSAKSVKHLGSHFIVRVESGQQSHSPTGKRLMTG